MHDNLPFQLTSFVGREAHIAQLEQLVSHNRLVSLVGPGGVGKTRMALEIARRHLDQHADGVWLIELGAVLDERHVARTLAATLNIREADDLPLVDTVVQALRARDTLLVLDNCEHVIDACASLATGLLHACPGLRMMTTSRVPLGVPGEVVSRVSPLDSREGAALFAARAFAARPDLRLPDESQRAVDRLCLALDGLPLAIELAAACLTFLSLGEVLERLDHRFGLLVARNQSVTPARHRTLRAVVDWSYELLPDDEQCLFRRLSVFSGGCTLQAVEAVCAFADVLRPLRALVEKSLVVADADADSGRTRYRMLETLRHYAADRLRDAGEEDSIRQRHLDWFLALAQASEPGLHGPRQTLWMRDLRAEMENFRAGLLWSSTAPVQHSSGLRLAAALASFWFLDGGSSEARDWFERLLATDCDSPGRALALAKYAFIHMRRGNPAAAKPLAHEAVRAAIHTADRTALAEALFQLGQITLEEHDILTAEPALTQALELSRQVEWPRPYAVLRHLARIMVETGRPQRGLAHYEEALDGAQQVQDENYVALLRSCLGDLALDLGDLAAARRHLQQSVAASARSGERVTSSLASLAQLAVAEGDPERAFRLAGAVAGLRKPSGSALLPTALARLERALSVATQSITISARDAALAEGARMTLEQALDYSLQCDSSTAPRERAVLTTREREVLVLLTRGLSNRHIAEQLVVSESTAKRHTEHIMSKLGLHTRAQVASWATQNGLSPGPSGRASFEC